MLDEARLRDMAGELTQIAGIVGVVLGGSRARGEHTPDSDVDLGLYYRPPLDLPGRGPSPGASPARPRA